MKQTCQTKSSKSIRASKQCTILVVSCQKLIIVIAPITKPSRPILLRKSFVNIDSSANLGFSLITSLLSGSKPNAIAGRLSVKRLMKSKCTGANGTGSPATDEQRTVKIAPKFPDKRNCIAYKIAYTVSSLRVLVFWIIYRATDMTIIIAHKPINRSDTIGVMWNHIICTAAVPYNKKRLLSFHASLHHVLFLSFCITRHPLTTIYSSLPAIITIKRSTCGKRVNRQINIAACVSLSATGSSIFPKLLILWNLLAIYPSARSVRPDSNKISPANRGFFFTQ